jgi:uncharacterized damage-inducible protein DinB
MHHQLAHYNLFANQRIIDWLSPVEASLLNTEVPSSYPTILSTLNHIWAAQEFWWSIIAETKEFNHRFGVKNFDKTEIFQGLLDNSKKYAEYLSALTPEHLQKVVPVHMPWLQCALTKEQYFMHCMNHSTYHRGQIITMARMSGITENVPNTDMAFFCAASA